MSSQIDASVSEYRRLVYAHGQLTSREFKKANRLFDAAHRIAKELRGSQEGRKAMLTLLNDPDASVRLGAATEALPVDPETALRVIDQIASSEGAHSFEAEMVAQEWRAGRLNLDW